MGWMGVPVHPEGVYRVRVTPLTLLACPSNSGSGPWPRRPRTLSQHASRRHADHMSERRWRGGADPTHFCTLRVHGDRDRPHPPTRPRRKVATCPSPYPALSHQHESQRLHSCATYEPSLSEPGRPSLHRQPRPKQATRSGVCKDVSRHRERRYAVNDSRYPGIWRPFEAAAVSGTSARRRGGHL